jgi:hypothetical protein
MKLCLLVTLEGLLLNSGVILLDSENGFGTLFVRQVACLDGAVWEKDANDNSEHDRNHAGYD